MKWTEAEEDDFDREQARVVEEYFEEREEVKI